MPWYSPEFPPRARRVAAVAFAVTVLWIFVVTWRIPLPVISRIGTVITTIAGLLGAVAMWTGRPDNRIEHRIYAGLFALGTGLFVAGTFAR